jgi:hypothetical protein
MHYGDYELNWLSFGSLQIDQGRFCGSVYELKALRHRDFISLPLCTHSRHFTEDAKFALAGCS